MQVKVKSNTSKTVVYRTRKLSVDKFIVTESYTDEVLVGQKWSVNGSFKKTHPKAYEPRHMHFAYYEDISFLDSDECCNYIKFHEVIPTPSMILDWDKFENLDHILCNYLGMDGNIYRINSPDPVPMWRHKGYISGFTNKDYDLTKVVKLLEKKSWIRNVEIIEIPYYNQDDGRTHAVEFDYKLPTKKSLGEMLSKNKIFEKHYFGFG